MVGRKVFKSRICDLYKKGRCNRNNCSFAHGDADLRRFNTNINITSSSSFHGRRDYRGADLREKLGRQRSPPRRNSLDRDARDPHLSHGHSSPRLGKKSDWGQKRRHHFDGESDYTVSLRSLDGVERHARERKSSLSEFKDVNGEQLEQVHSEIDKLEDYKRRMQIYLEESVQEADGLNSKIEEIEMQLSAEKEECKTISSKIRKFVKENILHARIQDKLKRSQARLQRLGDQLGSDARVVGNEEDISIDTSDEETSDNLLMSPQNDEALPRKDETFGNSLMDPRKDQYKVSPSKKRTRIRIVEADEPRIDETLGNPGRRKGLYKASPSKKRMRAYMVEADEKSKQANSAAGERRSLGHTRSERHYRWEPNVAQTKNTDKVREEANGTNSARPLANNIKPRQRKTNFTSASFGDKQQLKNIKSTRMVANMMDEVVDVVELNENPDAREVDAREVSPTRVEEGLTIDKIVLPPPPPLPVAEDAYLQHKGKDETVDVVTNDVGDTDDDDDDDDLNEVDDDDDDLNEVNDDEMLDVDIV